MADPGANTGGYAAQADHPRPGGGAPSAAFAEEFDRAAHSDPAEIPYPQGRDSEGYLPGDEFIYENEERGLWAYLSETLQVQIVRYEDTDPVRVWFEAEVRFKPERETFGSVTYGAAAFAGQQTYPETLAQSEQLVFAINGDYYPYRADRGHTVGNIIRQGQVLYSATGKRNRAYPVLDNLVLRDDGSMEDVRLRRSNGRGDCRLRNGARYVQLWPRTGTGWRTDGLHGFPLRRRRTTDVHRHDCSRTLPDHHGGGTYLRGPRGYRSEHAGAGCNTAAGWNRPSTWTEAIPL